MSNHERYIDFTPDTKLLVANIHPDAAVFMSKILADLANQLKDTAARKRQMDLEKVAYIIQRRHVDVLVSMEISKGKTLDMTIRKLATYGVPEADVRFLWKSIKPRVEASERRERQKTARRMKRHGYTNATIARKLNCSIRTVNRLLNGVIRAKNR